MNLSDMDAREIKHYTDLRRRLHENAECGFDLFKTRTIIVEELSRLGIEYKEIGRGSIAARIGRGECGVLLRADMDALYMKEATELPYASQSERMHACGHDMHTAMLLFALSLIKKEEAMLAHEVRVLFQAAEETLVGAADAIGSGILLKWGESEQINAKNNKRCKTKLTIQDELPFIQAAYSLHTVVGVPMKAGTLIVPNSGIGAPASDFFRICVTGTSAHGATPHLGNDALMAMTAIYAALTTLAGRVASPSDAALITVGKLLAGENPNVICPRAEAEGTVRSMDDEVQKKLRERMEESLAHIAAAFRVEAKLSFFGGAPTLKNHPSLVSLASEALRTHFPEQVVLAAQISGSESQKESGGSEDFASFSHRIPSLLVGICAGDSREGYSYPLHHPEVRFDERVLPIGALVYRELARLHGPSFSTPSGGMKKRLAQDQ